MGGVRNTVGAAGGSSGLATGGGQGGTTYSGTPYAGSGGPGGGGSGFGGFGGAGSGPAGGGAAGGGSLVAMLAGASSKELRYALEQFQGCLPALPAVDRQVLSMRAGLRGDALSRSQVASRLGLSQGAVVQTERRALTRLQFVSQQTGCGPQLVGPFDPAGIGSLLPRLDLIATAPVPGSLAAADYSPARGYAPRSASPLFELGDAGDSAGPAWAIVLFTVLFSVSIAALMRELRSSF